MQPVFQIFWGSARVRDEKPLDVRHPGHTGGPWVGVAGVREGLQVFVCLRLFTGCPMVPFAEVDTVGNKNGFVWKVQLQTTFGHAHHHTPFCSCKHLSLQNSDVVGLVLGPVSLLRLLPRRFSMSAKGVYAISLCLK